MNLITLIPVDMSGNFYAKRTCVQCCAVVRLETDPLLLSMSSTCFFIYLTSHSIINFPFCLAQQFSFVPSFMSLSSESFICLHPLSHRSCLCKQERYAYRVNRQLVCSRKNLKFGEMSFFFAERCQIYCSSM